MTVWELVNRSDVADVSSLPKQERSGSIHNGLVVVVVVVDASSTYCSFFSLPPSNSQIALDILNFLVLLLNGKIFICNWPKYFTPCLLLRVFSLESTPKSYCSLISVPDALSQSATSAVAVVTTKCLLSLNYRCGVTHDTQTGMPINQTTHG